MINVKNYGAIGDGVADDTVAVMAALEDMVGRPGMKGQNVFFPEGTYRITRPIVTDLTPLATNGVVSQSPSIYGAGANTVLDFTGITNYSGVLAAWTIRASVPVFYFKLGEMTILGNTGPTQNEIRVLQVGDHNIGQQTALNYTRLQNLQVCNQGYGLGTELNFLAGGDISGIYNTGWQAGLLIRGCQFCRFYAGITAYHGISLVFDDCNGCIRSNTFISADFESGGLPNTVTGIAIYNKYSYNNTFISPTFTALNQGIVVLAGDSSNPNYLINPSFISVNSPITLVPGASGSLKIL